MFDNARVQIQNIILQIWTWVQTNLLEWTRVFEIALILVIWFVSRIISTWLRGYIVRLSEDKEWIERIDRRFMKPIFPVAFSLTFIFTAEFIIEPFMGPAYFLGVATSLIAAWLVIRLAMGFVANRELARFISAMVWSVAALNIMGLLAPILLVLDSANLPLGESEISALDIISGIGSFAIFLWAALALASLIESRLKAMQGMPPSARVLIVKTGKIILVIIAFLMALTATGIDLTALAVFGGALGVGIGFGLQRVVGNFISGLILLLDNSIKPGDVIETGGTYGIINKLAARYTSVITRDGTEFLIPNEDLLTKPVINWSHSDSYVRRKIPLQISYNCDPNKAMELMIEAALTDARVLRTKKRMPVVRFMDFGDSGITLELRMWLGDPHDGVNNVASNIRLAIWDLFKKNGIEFPYPTRTLYVKKEPGAEPLI